MHRNKKKSLHSDWRQLSIDSIKLAPIENQAIEGKEHFMVL